MTSVKDFRTGPAGGPLRRGSTPTRGADARPGRHAGHHTSTSVRFAAAARALADAARARQLVVPGFRSPPKLREVDRTIRRRPDGGATVAVQLADRPWPAVLADMVEGVVVANRLEGAEAMRVRTALWAALDAHQSEAA
jgi:hypothetical protein